MYGETGKEAVHKVGRTVKGFDHRAEEQDLTPREGEHSQACCVSRKVMQRLDRKGENKKSGDQIKDMAEFQELGMEGLP